MLNLTKFESHDYDCFGGVELNDFMSDAFITWDVSYIPDGRSAAFGSVCLLDAMGLHFEVYDDGESIVLFTLDCSVSVAKEWLEKHENNKKFRRVDFKDWKELCTGEMSEDDPHWEPNGQPNGKYDPASCYGK